MMRAAGVLLLALSAGAVPAAAFERSRPLDCLPDRLAEWKPAGANPLQLFGAPFVPGIVLGPPGASLPSDGSFSVATLGFGGSATVEFVDAVIEDRPGPDFIVFENAFFRLPLPEAEGDPFRIFAEPAHVEVSADGESWHRFPSNPLALAAASGVPDVNADSFAMLAGLAGVTPTFTGNWTVPDDRDAFDPAGPGGVSGAGGDAFDLADVGLAEARFVRVIDADSRNGFAGAGEGFDLDAVVALHARPAPMPGADSDGDGLGDLAEQRWYGSDPHDADTDGDGIDDGREVAGCRDPGSFDEAPWYPLEARLWLLGAACTEARFAFAGTGRTFDLVRGNLGAFTELPLEIDVGAVQCLAAAQTSLRFSCDASVPAPGTGFFYLARVTGAAGYGRSSSLTLREVEGGCP